MKITMISKELILPSSPTPFELATYKLSYLDQHIPPHFVSFILYYSHHESESKSESKSNNITQSEMIIKLKTSLSKTLTYFYPLAGRLPKNQNTVDCNDQGVWFLVTRVESNLLDVMKSPVIQELSQLVAVKAKTFVEEQLAIQVNLFDCGGIAVGVSILHRIADACSFSTFVNHWFTMAKGVESRCVSPIFDTSVFFPPMDSNEYNQNTKNDTTVHVPSNNLVTKRFVFSSLAINKLKHEVVKDDCTIVNPTKVEVVTALIWKCASDCKASMAFHMVNFRRKMDPLLQDHQFGNLFTVAGAEADQTDDMPSRVANLRGSFKNINSQFLKILTGENGINAAKVYFKEIQTLMSREDVRVLRFSSWCRFGFYESDFGWGKPVLVSTANFSTENMVLLMDSRSHGGIEAWVAMNEDNMQIFEQNAELQAYLG